MFLNSRFVTGILLAVITISMDTPSLAKARKEKKLQDEQFDFEKPKKIANTRAYKEVEKNEGLSILFVPPAKQTKDSQLHIEVHNHTKFPIDYVEFFYEVHTNNGYIVRSTDTPVTASNLAGNLGSGETNVNTFPGFDTKLGTKFPGLTHVAIDGLKVIYGNKGKPKTTKVFIYFVEMVK